MTDFCVCVDKYQAMQLLQFALVQESLTPQQNARKLPSNAWLQTVRAKSIRYGKGREQQRHHGEFVNSLENFKYNFDGCVDFSVVVDLCRPYRYWTHRLLIPDSLNLDTRSYSNSRDGTNLTSCLFENVGGRVWCPNSSSDQMSGAPDFVVLQMTNSKKQLCLEGVAVNASGPVGIQVDIDYFELVSTGKWEHRAWVPVAQGALLRPIKTETVAGNGHLISVQLIPFPDPYFGIRLRGVRITMVECDGKAVRVGLIISDFAKKNMIATPGDTICTKNFNAVDNYRAWWYRLQAVRDGVQQKVPSFCELRDKAGRDLGDFEEAKALLNRTMRPRSARSCYDRLDKNCVTPVIYLLVYGCSLLVAFPIMLAMNLDHLEANATTTSVTNSTTSPHYTMARPNPERTLRTICWQNSSGHQSPPVSWPVVFFPFLFSFVFALLMILARVREMFNIYERTKGIVARLRKADHRLKDVPGEVKAHMQAVDQVSADPKIRDVVEAATRDYIMVDVWQQRDIPKNIYLESGEHIVLVFFDVLVLIICSFAAVACAVAEWWCRLELMGSEETVALPIIYVVLCVVADATIGMLFSCVCTKRLVDVDENVMRRTCLVILVASAILLQQLLLLLEMFTFFHRVSFFFVFSPLLIVIVGVCLWSFTSSLIATLAIFLVLISPSVVLLMLKVDKLFGIGAALLLGPAFPQFSWVVIMIPIWVALGLFNMLSCCMLCINAIH